jgi:hypothetical protein
MALVALTVGVALTALTATLGTRRRRALKIVHLQSTRKNTKIALCGKSY